MYTIYLCDKSRDKGQIDVMKLNTPFSVSICTDLIRNEIRHSCKYVLCCSSTHNEVPGREILTIGYIEFTVLFDMLTG